MTNKPMSGDVCVENINISELRRDVDKLKECVMSDCDIVTDAKGSSIYDVLSAVQEAYIYSKKEEAAIIEEEYVPMGGNHFDLLSYQCGVKAAMKKLSKFISDTEY